VRLSRAATDDFHNILHWTAEQLGDAQALNYEQTLTSAIDALAAGPERVRAKHRDDLLAGLMTLHVARRGRRGRHLAAENCGAAQY
jgi:toxin ParE1/3/4